MRLVPENNDAKIRFFQSRLTPWTERAEEIGTTPEQVALLVEQTEAAREAFKQQQRAMQAAQGATIALNEAIARMGTTGASIVKQIRAKALVAGEGIYSRAFIPPPGDGGPIAEPGMPQVKSATLDQIGAITLRWTCKNPRGATGTTYQLKRSLDGGAFAYLGTTGDKKFADETIPQGTRAIVYQLQAIRSTAVGPVSTYNVTFGSNGFRPSQMQLFKTRKATVYAA